LEKKTQYQCLYIGRKFLSKGVYKPEGFDAFTLEYDEVYSDFSLIKKAFAQSGKDIKLVVKPHPSSNFLELKKLIDDVGIKNYTISHETFYGLLNNIDFCISPFSTSILIPAMAGIPVIILNSKLQDYVHNKWGKLKEMYTGMSYYLNNNDDMGQYISEIILKLENDEFIIDNEETLFDIAYLRNYFRDNAINRAIERLNYLSRGIDG